MEDYMLRKHYNALSNHEKLLTEDLKNLEKAVRAYADSHTTILGFPDNDLVELNHAVDKLAGRDFSTFYSSTCSMIDNISLAFLDFNKPDEVDELLKMMQDSDKESHIKRLPNSIKRLIEDIKLFLKKINDNPTQELCKSLLPKLQSFEATVISCGKEELIKVDESKNPETNSTNVKDQKKTVNSNFQDQKNPSISLDYPETLFVKNNSSDSERNVNNNAKKLEKERKEITPPKSSVNNKPQ